MRGGDRALGVGTAADGARRGPWAAGAAAPWPLSGLRGVTQVLLPATLLLRRADVAAVVYRALVWWAVGGLGRRRIAGLLGVTRSTVRGWLARFEVLAEVLPCAFHPLGVVAGAGGTRLESHGWVVADALAALLAAGRRPAEPTAAWACGNSRRWRPAAGCWPTPARPSRRRGRGEGSRLA